MASHPWPGVPGLLLHLLKQHWGKVGTFRVFTTVEKPQTWWIMLLKKPQWQLCHPVYCLIIIYSRWERRAGPKLCHRISRTGTDRSVSRAAIATTFLSPAPPQPGVLYHEFVQPVTNSATLCWEGWLWWPQVDLFSSLPSSLIVHNFTINLR